jgi:hypothetical protein
VASSASSVPSGIKGFGALPIVHRPAQIDTGAGAKMKSNKRLEAMPKSVNAAKSQML